MAFERIEVVESIDVRLTNGQIGIRKVIMNQLDGETISENTLTFYYNKGDDLSQYPSIVQDVAELFWSEV